MARFFMDTDQMQGDTLVLTGENAQHARVLRLKAGEEVLVCDGQGTRSIGHQEGGRKDGRNQSQCQNEGKCALEDSFHDVHSFLCKIFMVSP